MVLLPRFSSSIFVLLILLFASRGHAFAEKKSYIVYLGEHSHGPEITEQDIQRVTNSHHDLLASFLGSKEKAKEAIFYSYTKHINGFAATLEEEVAASIARHPDVLLVTPNERRKLHTTHSWEFLSLENNGGAIQPSSLWKKANYGEDIIIATLDTGVWPESKSFSDKNYGPIPSRWKGACEDTQAPHGIRCNKKLIGAKKYNKGYIEGGGQITNETDTVRDLEGHGTHTLSTAAGNFVPGADLFGIQLGTTKGGSPRARVAAYKVCWEEGCSDADIVQGLDNAIHDGVDVISMSLGGDPQEYDLDITAIAAFHAVKKNIVVVCSAGNSGPDKRTVTNIAPWIITVAASTLDRDYQSGIKLQNGLLLKPDITAPGVNVIASYSPAGNPTMSPGDHRHTSFAFLSGTSMSCPHVSGVIGLLKKLHPRWSPAALRSAILTTARPRDNTNSPIQDGDKKATPYAYGAGHIRPNEAADPGLVYDLTIEDHLNFLCSIGYKDKTLQLFSGKPYECPQSTSIMAYNHPSISVPLEKGNYTVTRKLKNVGPPGTYVAHVRHLAGVIFSVEPNRLTFKKVGEEKSFKLNIGIPDDSVYIEQYGELVWRDGKHYVRSPIVIFDDIILQ